MITHITWRKGQHCGVTNGFNIHCCEMSYKKINLYFYGMIYFPVFFGDPGGELIKKLERIVTVSTMYRIRNAHDEKHVSFISTIDFCLWNGVTHEIQHTVYKHYFNKEKEHNFIVILLQGQKYYERTNDYYFPPPDESAPPYIDCTASSNSVVRSTRSNSKICLMNINIGIIPIDPLLNAAYFSFLFSSCIYRRVFLFSKIGWWCSGQFPFICVDRSPTPRCVLITPMFAYIWLKGFADYGTKLLCDDFP